MSDEKREPWMGRMALVTVLFAVCATLSTFKGSSYSTRSVINQALASDQWAFYQAKSIKQHFYEMNADQIDLQLAQLPKNSPAHDVLQRKAVSYRDEIKRYSSEKKEIEAKAKEYEKQREEATRHSQPLGIAVIFFQISILLTSIAGLMKMQKVWWCAIPTGLAGVVYFLDGFLLFF